MPSLPLEPDAAALDAVTAACVAFVRDHLATLATQPASDVDDAAPLARTFHEPAPEHGTPIEAILARLAPAIAKTFNTAGPGYLAFIPGGGLPTAALGDYIALATNRYVGVVRTAPALVAIESASIAWLARIVGYPGGAGGVLTSGGSMSNLLAVVTARTERLGERFHDGTMYVSRETHRCVVKAARVAGIARAHVREIPTDARRRIDVAALERALDADTRDGLRPFLLVANAGTTNTGAIDPLSDLVPLARARGLWLHADAAYGGFFAMVPEARARLAGLADCDSITLDPHKGLFLPYGTGALVLRDPGALRRAHAGDAAAYLQDVAPDDGAVDFADMTPELSREFRGLRLWLPFQLHGLQAFRDQLTEKLRLTRLAYETLIADGRFEILDEPQLTVLAFRLRNGDDATNARLLAAVNATQRVILSSTVLDDRLTLRLCILSFRTHEDRVREALALLSAEATRQMSMSR